MLALQSTDHIYKRTNVCHDQWPIRSLLSKSGWLVAGHLLLSSLMDDKAFGGVAFLSASRRERLWAFSSTVRWCSRFSWGLEWKCEDLLFTIKHNFHWSSQRTKRLFQLLTEFLDRLHNWRFCNFFSWDLKEIKSIVAERSSNMQCGRILLHCR